MITAYTLAFGGLLLLGGRTADLVGRKRTFVIGLVGFAAASALGGAATSAGRLFGARALQGVFAAVLAPSGGSIGTALLNTIATTSSAAYITAHLTDPARRAPVTEEGIVHGYTVAIWWAAAITLPAGVIAALMVTAKPPKHGAAQEAQIPESVA